MHKNRLKSILWTKNVKKSHFFENFFHTWTEGCLDQVRTVSETRIRARSARQRSTVTKSKEISDIRPRSRLSKWYILWASSAPRWPIFNPIFALWPPQLVTMEKPIHFWIAHTFFRVVSRVFSHFRAQKVVKMAKISHFWPNLTSISGEQTLKPNLHSLNLT